MNTVFTQKFRQIAVEDNPLGKDVLLLTGFTGEEALSHLFNFQLEVLSERSDIASKDIVGKKITFRVGDGEDRARYFNGYVNRFTASSLTFQGMRLYRADVVPWLWFLARTADCRIFQNQTIPQIIEQVFADHSEIQNYEIAEVKGSYPEREFCVQYRETDFNFVSRLMEEEGIFYWFRHEQDKHILVLADQKGAYKDLPDKEVDFVSGTGETLAQSQLYQWERCHEFHSGKWMQTDYNFATPSTKLHTSSQTIVDLPDTQKYEIFEYPGQYATRDDGEKLTKVRMEETEASFDQVNAASTYCSFAPGGKFTLKRHECASEEGKTYLVTAIKHQAEEQTYLGGEDANQRYNNTLTCIPADVIYRPTRKTSRPFVQGPQTAVIVGPSGEEIHTDGYGRVKVQFHWDRYGEFNEHSSCWIRVSQVHAGKGFGGIDIPRIGEEVIVEFLEGDPDQPIITGRVYNAEQMPPYELPANKTQTGILTRSSKEGSGANANELRFEDKKGEEQVYLHAEKNQDISVENDETHTVGHDRTKTVGNNETITVVSNRTENVGVNETITIGSNRTKTVKGSETASVVMQRTHLVGVNETIGVGGAQEIGVGAFQAVVVGAYQTINVGAYQNTNVGAYQSNNIGLNQTTDVGGNQSESVKGNASKSVKGNDSLSVDKSRSANIKEDDATKVGKNLLIDAGDSVTIKTGKASISMKKDGTIVIKGKDVTVDGSGKISAKAGGDIVMKGKKILQN